METTVTAQSPVDYTLDLHVPADEIEPRVTAALKQQRGRMNLKGFRPGRVPLSYVKKMVGSEVAVQVAEELIGEAFKETVQDDEQYDVIGQPRLAELDYDFKEGGDLRAVVRFGVRPQFDLAEMDGVPVTKYVRTFTDDDVEAELEGRRARAAELEEAPEGAAVGETDAVTVDIQPVDPEGEPTGPVQHDARLLLADPNIRPELKEALAGAHVGDAVRIELPHLHGPDEGHDHDDHVDRYRMTVKAIHHRVLPPLDADFIREQTNGEHDDLDGLKADIRQQLEQSWARRAQEAMEAKMAEQFVEAHAFDVPQTLVEASLDAMLDEVRERQQGQFPEGFDVEGWREARREQAENQVRWLLVKQKLIEEEGLEVTTEDFEAEFEKISGEGAPVEAVRAYFSQQPRLIEQMGDHLLNRRVFDALGTRFSVVEKSREDLERERAERQANEAAEAEVAEMETAEAGEAPKKRGLFGRKKG
ncbi:MAG: trigger factor [Rubricoccaceae bacterium]|nr:trigger factor [Rubricoccaceae bacterium]